MEERPISERPSSERREHHRRKVTIRVQFKNIEKFKEEWTENISHGGIFIKSSNQLDLHTTVELTLQLPDQDTPIILTGEVVRTVSQREAQEQGIAPGFAIEFLDFAKKRKDLDEFIKKVSASGAAPRDAAIRLGPPPEAESPSDSEGQDKEADDSEFSNMKAIQIKNMSVKEKMVLAPKADKPERAVLLRDLNASVARLLIRNPRITESEITQIAKDVAMPSDVLELIAKNRKWVQNQDVRLAIVKNPRTPTPLVVTQLNFLQIKDLAILAKSQNVRETIKNEAFKMLLKKRDKTF
jgi:uncharacterized protein (TIGR02266 family)